MWRSAVVPLFAALVTAAHAGCGPASKEAISDDARSPPVHRRAEARRSAEAWVTVPLPRGVAPEELARPGPAARKLLAAAAEQQLGSRTPGAMDVLVFVDAQGRPLLPDAAQARQARAAGPATGEEERQLSFTFDSPEPWTAEELAAVQRWLSLCYPAIRTLFGPPAFSIAVNLQKGATGFSGTYNPSVNTITLSTLEAPVLCHELVHAFRDDDLLRIGVWEEGMARATEVEATTRLGIANRVDHTYYYDVYYEELNVPLVGAAGGMLWTGWSQTLLRYQLAGYAWAKALIEDLGFLVAFNSSLYARAAADPGVLQDEAALVSLAAAARPTVEGQELAAWYARQHVLDTHPPVGDFVFVRSSGDFAVSVFARSPQGGETNYSGVAVEWTATDAGGAVLGTGSDITNSAGSIMMFIPIPADYVGRVKLTAAGAPGGLLISGSAYGHSSRSAQGVFGVVEGAELGEVAITPLDPPGSMVRAPVSRGAFEVPELQSFRGQLGYVFVGPGVESAPAVVTKDAAPYFLHVIARPVLTILPMVPVASPRESLTFEASGGSGAGYTWSLATNASGGSIGTSSGVYTAGAIGSVFDVVQVTDSLGATGRRTVEVEAGVTISPDSATVPPGGSLSFVARGGSGTGYTWSLATNASGGSIGTSSGTYTAGATGGVIDVVEVADSLGNTATQGVMVERPEQDGEGRGGCGGPGVGLGSIGVVALRALLRRRR